MCSKLRGGLKARPHSQVARAKPRCGGLPSTVSCGGLTHRWHAQSLVVRLCEPAQSSSPPLMRHLPGLLSGGASAATRAGWSPPMDVSQLGETSAQPRCSTIASHVFICCRPSTVHRPPVRHRAHAESHDSARLATTAIGALPPGSALLPSAAAPPAPTPAPTPAPALAPASSAAASLRLAGAKWGAAAG